MSVDGGVDVCEGMVQQDIMTPLVALLQKTGEMELATEGDQVLLQALHLLWNLSEVSPVCIKIINQQNLLPILLRCVVPSNHGYQIATTAAQCLYTVTEDNSEAVARVTQADVLPELQSLLTAETSETDSDSSDQLLLRVLLIGILYNTCNEQLGGLRNPGLGQILEILKSALQQDILSRLIRISHHLLNLQSEDQAAGTNGCMSMEEEDLGQSVSDSAEDSTTENAATEDATASSEKCESEAATNSKQQKKQKKPLPEDPLERRHRELDGLLADCQQRLVCQQLAIELVANFCCDGDESADCEDVEISDTSSDEMPADGTTEEMVEDTELEDTLCLPSEVQNAFASSGLVMQVFDKMKGIESKIIEELKSHDQSRKLCKSLDTLQLRALLCTSNLVSSLGVADIGGLEVLQQMWPTLSEIVSTAASASHADTLEGATNALRAVIEKLAEEDSDQLSRVTDEDLQFLYSLGRECTVPQVRAHTTRIVAMVASHMVEHDKFHLLQSVGDFLYHVASQDAELWVVAEALDATFDVFAEDKTDPVVKERGLVAKLRQLVPALKTKVQDQKRLLGEHKSIVIAAKTNLARFIRYKANRPSASS